MSLIVTSRANREHHYTGVGYRKPLPPMIEDKLSYEVEFDGPSDSLNPYNWSPAKKILCLLSVIATSGVFSWYLAIYSVTENAVSQEFHVGKEVSILGISLLTIGYASGPILWGPLSEFYGRRNILLIGTAISCIFCFSAGSAKDLQTLFLSRSFFGFTGGSSITVAASICSDMFDKRHRGTMIFITFSQMFILTLVAPIVGGFIVESPSLGWRWVHYISGILVGAACVFSYLFCAETYYKTILAHKAAELRHQTGNWAIYAPVNLETRHFAHTIKVAITRPLRMLVTKPALLVICIYVAYVYGLLFLFIQGYPIVFAEKYKMSSTISQLPFFGVVIGMFCAMVLFIILEQIHVRFLKVNQLDVYPEGRLKSMILPGILFPIGIFWFAWMGNYPQVFPWPAPAIGGLIAGFGLNGILLSAYTYMMESYFELSASAMAASIFLRSLFATVYPLFADQLFYNLGIQYGGTLLGSFAALGGIIPILFYIYAERLKRG